MYSAAERQRTWRGRGRAGCRYICALLIYFRLVCYAAFVFLKNVCSLLCVCWWNSDDRSRFSVGYGWNAGAVAAALCSLAGPDCSSVRYATMIRLSGGSNFLWMCTCASCIFCSCVSLLRFVFLPLSLCLSVQFGHSVAFVGAAARERGGTGWCQVKP